MDANTKKAIGQRLRERRERAGYTRERLGELCGLSPRFIANIEFGDSTFSLDSLMTVCRVLSCGADALLFGDTTDRGIWTDTLERVRNIDTRYKPEVDKLLQALVEAVSKGS